MRVVELDKSYFQGAVSIEQRQDGWQPWRLPFASLLLHPPILQQKASHAAGVRLAFISDTRSLRINLAPCEQSIQMDCVVNNELHDGATIVAGDCTAVFAALPEGRKRIELYLPQKHSVAIQHLIIDDAAEIMPLEEQDVRKRWITYGSSITQCGEAASPAETWPALIARRNDLNLTCLGYGGQCQLDPMIGLMIRDMPADFISLCLGVNVMGKSSMDLRVFKSAAIGFIMLIRERHRSIPLMILSPIFSGYQETKDNVLGVNLVKLRSLLQEIVKQLQMLGDQHIYYIDGLQLFSQDDAMHLPDDLHPNAEGYRIMADRIQRYMIERYFQPGEQSSSHTEIRSDSNGRSTC